MWARSGKNAAEMLKISILVACLAVVMGRARSSLPDSTSIGMQSTDRLQQRLQGAHIRRRFLLSATNSTNSTNSSLLVTPAPRPTFVVQAGQKVHNVNFDLKFANLDPNNIGDTLRTKIREALAAALGVNVANVKILAIIAGRRRLLAAVVKAEVQTQTKAVADVVANRVNTISNFPPDLYVPT